MMFSLKHREDGPAAALRCFAVGLPHLLVLNEYLCTGNIYKMWIERILTWLGYKRIERDNVYKESASI